MDYFLTVSSHHWTQCWLVIKGILIRLRAISQRNAILYDEFNNHTFRINATCPRGQWGTNCPTMRLWWWCPRYKQNESCLRQRMYFWAFYIENLKVKITGTVHMNSNNVAFFSIRPFVKLPWVQTASFITWQASRDRHSRIRCAESKSIHLTGRRLISKSCEDLVLPGCIWEIIRIDFKSHKRHLRNATVSSVNLEQSKEFKNWILRLGTFARFWVVSSLSE